MFSARRLGLISLLGLGLVPALATGAASAAPRVEPGVRAAGIDLGGMTVEEATARLAPVEPLMRKTVIVAVAGERYRMRMKDIGLQFDARRTAYRALALGDKNPPAPGTAVDVPLYTTFSNTKINTFVAQVLKGATAPARNASVTVTTSKVTLHRAATGRTVDRLPLVRTLRATVVNPGAERLIKPGRKAVQPAVTDSDARRQYGTVVTVNRATYRLGLFKNLKLVKTYSVAVGAEGYSTPARLYRVTSRSVNPTWTAPNSPWAGIYAGRTVPGGSPENPLKARWIGLADGIGIHGTGDESTIGSRASHGCIRMRVADVKDLYPRVPMGTPVLIR